MKISECIVSRRSIRRFTSVMPDMSEISNIISLASYAPSWKNTQTASYIVIKNHETKQAIADSMDFAPNKATTENAPMLIVMTTKTGRSGFEHDGSYSSERKDGWQMFDAGIACQTLCLAAHSRGLGSVIMGIYNDEAAREILQISEDRIITAIVAVGYPDQNPIAPKRRALDEIMSVI